MTLAHHAPWPSRGAPLPASTRPAPRRSRRAEQDDLLAMLVTSCEPAVRLAKRWPCSALRARRPRPPAREIIVRQNAPSPPCDDLLDVARVTSGKIALERRPVGWRKRCGTASRRSPRAGAPSTTTLVALDPVGPRGRDTLRADRRNLVGNALRFTPAEVTSRFAARRGWLPCCASRLGDRHRAGDAGPRVRPFRSG